MPECGGGPVRIDQSGAEEEAAVEYPGRAVVTVELCLVRRAYSESKTHFIGVVVDVEDVVVGESPDGIERERRRRPVRLIRGERERGGCRSRDPGPSQHAARAGARELRYRARLRRDGTSGEEVEAGVGAVDDGRHLDLDLRATDRRSLSLGDARGEKQPEDDPDGEYDRVVQAAHHDAIPSSE